MKVTLTALGIVLAAALVVSCGEEVEVRGGTDSTVDVNYTDTEVKMKDGIFYVREVRGPDTVCMAVDSSILYNDVWSSITEADAVRLETVPYTVAETEACITQ